MTSRAPRPKIVKTPRLIKRTTSGRLVPGKATSRAANTSAKTEKIAISLPAQVAAQARQAVAEGRATSVSAYFADAAVQVEREGALRALLDDLTEQHGSPSAEDYAWADEALGPK